MQRFFSIVTIAASPWGREVSWHELLSTFVDSKDIRQGANRTDVRSQVVGEVAVYKTAAHVHQPCSSERRHRDLRLRVAGAPPRG